MKRLTVLIASCLLSACAIMPEPASTSLLGKTRDLSQVEGTVNTSMPDDWWRLYEDPLLDGLIEAALAANADLRVAYANLDAARARLGQARIALAPQTAVESGLSVDDSSTQPSAFNVPSTDWDFGITASWEIDIFGRLRAQALAAGADYDALEAALYGVKVAVVADTANAYMALCGATEAAVVASEVTKRQERYVELLEKQRTAGEISPLEVAQAQAQAASLRAAIHPFVAQQANARYRLATLQGLPPAEARRFNVACTASPRLRGAAPIGDASALLLRRPDIREAEQRLVAATARIGVAKAELYPRVNLAGALGILSGGFASVATPLVTWSFPNQGPARARIAESSAQAQAALAKWDAVILQALLEVESALSIYDAERRRNRALVEAANEADAYARLAAARVRAGDVSALLRIDAERTLVSARLAQVQSDLAVTQSHVALYRALGGGWMAAN